MSLRKCSVCSKDISTQAVACPHCGHSIAGQYNFAISNGLILFCFVTIAGIINYSNDSPPEQSPEAEIEFCTIINAATATYNSLERDRKTAYREKNLISWNQITHDMGAKYRKRNIDVLASLKEIDFRFEGWIMSIDKVRGASPSSVRFDIKPICSTITTLHARVTSTPQNIDFLAKKKREIEL
jgi:hypothetical protein